MLKGGMQSGMYVVFALLIGLLSVVIAVKTIAGTAASADDTQAALIGDFIASSINSLSSMEKGESQKEFQIPVTVEIYRFERLCFLPFGKECGYYVRVTYKVGDKEKTYEAKILGNVEAKKLVNIKNIYIIKEPDKPVEISSLSALIEDCIEPLFKDILGYVSEASNKYGVEKALIMSVVQTESSFHQCIRSGAGALGLMQLMPETAEGLGVDPLDANENVYGGTRYLRDLLNRYKNKELAVAAYNAGPERVNGWRECIEDNDASWDEIISNQKIIVLENPDKKNKCHMALETRNYVPIVLCFYNSCYAKGMDTCSVKCRG